MAAPHCRAMNPDAEQPARILVTWDAAFKVCKLEGLDEENRVLLTLRAENVDPVLDLVEQQRIEEGAMAALRSMLQAGRVS